MNIHDIFVKLPDDIKKKIYIDHFESIEKYNKLTKILESIESQRLNSILLEKYIKNNNILNDVKFIKYMQDEDEHFYRVYKYHYIDDKKTFTRMPKFESFCTAWLFNLYH